MVVGPQAYHRLPEMLDKAVKGERATDTDMPAIAKFAALPERRRTNPASFLTVQEGCDKFCTYCVVPYTRGAEISRPYSDLVIEAKKLVDAGREGNHAAGPERQRVVAATTTRVTASAWRVSSAIWRRSMDLRASAIPPAILPTWTMT